MTPTSPTPRALLLAGLAFLLTACSADVSGTVHVTTKSGGARRGADVPVLLVREQFMGEWTEASGVAFIRSDQEAADTPGWTRRPRIEEAITVQVWVCVNTAKTAASR
jgi:hypothetical protein